MLDIKISATLFLLIIATITDIKKLEIPDWLNYAGIIAGIGMHLILSAQQWSIWPIASSIIGLVIAFGLACLMFYTGQWGGGDSKLLMAMGAMIGFQADKLGTGTSFLINLIFVGGAWGVVWTFYMAAKNWKDFIKEFKKIRQQKPFTTLRILTLLIATFMIIISFILIELQLQMISLALITYALCYLTIIIKATEKSSMHKWITPDQLTEGDWILQPVKADGIIIKPEKLGLKKEQVKKIQQLYKQNKISKVLVKYGVPFAPAFLIAYILTIIFNNVLYYLLF